MDDMRHNTVLIDFRTETFKKEAIPCHPEQAQNACRNANETLMRFFSQYHEMPGLERIVPLEIYAHGYGRSVMAKGDLAETYIVPGAQTGDLDLVELTKRRTRRHGVCGVIPVGFFYDLAPIYSVPDAREQRQLMREFIHKLRWENTKLDAKDRKKELIRQLLVPRSAAENVTFLNS